MAKIKGWELKNIRTWEGREGEGAQGDIYYKGKRVGWYNDSADGGPVDINLHIDELQEQLDADVKAYFTVHPDPLCVQYDIEPDADIFFAELLSLIEKEKTYKKNAKKGFPVTVVEEEAGGWSSIGIKSVAVLDKAIQQCNLSKDKLTVYTCLEDFNIR